MASEVERCSSSCTNTIKFLCSYGGRILPRRSDGDLRYVGGFTRILAVDRSVSYAELTVKLVEFCGFSVTLRCQLPDGDLETLISIKSDEDLASIVKEYDSASPGQKIRAILIPPKSLKQVSPPTQSTASIVGFSIYNLPASDCRLTRHLTSEPYALPIRPPARRFPIIFNSEAGKSRCINLSYYARGGRARVFSGAACCCNYSPGLPENGVRGNLRTY